MTVKYRTGGWGETLIEPVEVVKETAKTITVKTFSPHSNRWLEERRSKFTDFSQYHNTWEEAHTFLMVKAAKDVEDCRMALERARGELGNIKGLKKPEAAE